MWVLSRKTIAASTIIISAMIVFVSLMTLSFIRNETRDAHAALNFEVHDLIDQSAIKMTEVERGLSNLLINNGNSSPEDIREDFQSLLVLADQMRRSAPRAAPRDGSDFADEIDSYMAGLERAKPLLTNFDDVDLVITAREHFIDLKKTLNGLRETGSHYGADYFHVVYDLLERRFAGFVVVSGILGLAVVILVAILARQVTMLRQTNRHAVSLTQHLTLLTKNLEQTSAELEDQNRKLLDSESELGRQNYLFQAALKNMQEGLCMVDGRDRIAIANKQYISLYRLDPERCLPGISVDALIAQLAETGLCPPEHIAKLQEKRWHRRDMHYSITRDRFLTDGRIIQVHECPLEDGGWLTTHEDVTELRRSHDSAQHLATHDPLTGLANRTRFNETLKLAIEGRNVTESEVALILFDLDRFKGVNDIYGHASGDRLLEILARRLTALTNGLCLVARLGGDEFGVIIEGSQTRHTAERVAREIVDAIKRPFDLGFARVEIGVSVGVAVTPEHGLDAHLLLRNADLALYTVKSARLNTYQFFDPAMSEKIETRRILEAELAQALISEQLRLHYQPIVCTRSGDIVGAEALLRWTSPSMGPVPADEIISIANETGLILAMGDWIIDEAIRTAATWPDNLSIAINLSPRQFRKKDLTRSVLETLGRHRVAADRVNLEVTETVLCEDAVGDIMRELRDFGIRFSLDDFGTGYASLSYLTRFPFDVIKIDKSFVRSAPERTDCRAIIDTVCRLASALGLETLAEGIETERELEIVHQAGCGQAQGYLFGRPLPAADFLTLVKAQSGTAPTSGNMSAA